MKTNDLDFRISDTSTEGVVKTLEDYLVDIDKPQDTPSLVIEEDDDDTGSDDPIDDIVVEKGKGKKELEVDLDKDTPPTETKVLPSAINYKGVLQELMDNQLLDSFDEIELEDGSTIPFDEMEVDKETFSTIIATALEEMKEKASEGKVSTQGISDFTKQLIEVEKSGGDVAQAIASYQKYQEPLTSLDLSNERDQEVAIYIRYNAQGLSDAEISKITKGFKAQGILEEEAYKAKDVVDQAFQQHMDALAEEARAAEAARKENLVKYRSTLSESLDKLSVSKALKKQILDSATKENTEKSFDLDKAYYKLRNNPEEAAELALFILNREEYLSRVTNKATREEALNTMKKFKLAKKTSGNLNLGKQDDRGSKGKLSIEDIFS